MTWEKNKTVAGKEAEANWEFHSQHMIVKSQNKGVIKEHQQSLKFM